jgi:site-specific DNA-methyltransferase (adenine-specific)
MTQEELKALPVESIANKDCVLFLWVSNPQLPKAFDLLAHWNFDYKTVFKVWRKTNKDGSPVCVPGWWSRSSTELLLVGAKGSPLCKWKTSNNEPQEYASTREGHSKKPDEIRNMITNFLNVSSRIEIFARSINTDWDAWGLDIPGYFHENTGIATTECKEMCRSLGIQCNMLEPIKAKKKGNTNFNGGVKNHKPDCKCFICKNARLKNVFSTIINEQTETIRESPQGTEGDVRKEE